LTLRLSPIESVSPDLIAHAELAVDTAGEGFVEITAEARRFVSECGAGDGVLLLFLQHTSASLTVQENADPDVQTDLTSALRRLAPAEAPWVHTVEGSDDMPGHVKTMLTRSASGRASIWSSIARGRTGATWFCSSPAAGNSFAAAHHFGPARRALRPADHVSLPLQPATCRRGADALARTWH
jgi:secondary thiamine-phosphate synthase enzyme